ncbi:hypothetical protein J7T55_004605 [Diaporthe amygdali]|uniref:uncharacterized protein n=1 Tax=Phomopsis amygdali TaxID=1214568 RepID=UPI0022FEF9A3|nr:uncharacterized protein J7T55_004605 [Diaporthe amygdali]KAJ0114863.1 hypothetical protein J7T55_004605 [Diaporthe amygdali]
MAAVTRQPFAPLDGTRLQSLTSARNQQASIPLSSPGKRKAADFLNVDDFENVDPALLFSKRSKGSTSDGASKDFFKPPTFIITKSSSTSALPSSKDGISASVFSSPLKGGASPRVRSILNPKSPARKLSSLARGPSSPMSAPAGRSPTRGNKRIGILNRRRTGTFTRIDPPTFSLSSTPFSLEAAIKGTVPSYAARTPSSTKASSATSSSLSLSNSDDFYGLNVKSSWEFDIHEDTPEQEMTNLLQHSTCRLDISSDEECQQKLGREKAEGRGKENVPPADDISQTSARRATAISEGGMEYEKPRTALGDLNVEDFYAEGCDPTSVFIVPEDEDDGTVVDGEQSEKRREEDVAQELSLETKASMEAAAEPEDSEELVQLATLQPVEGTGESFDLWESSSAKEEGDGARSPSPMPASPASETGEDFGDEG